MALAFMYVPSFSVTSQINDYYNYLFNIRQYSDNVPSSPSDNDDSTNPIQTIPPLLTQIDGFELLFDEAFDVALPFSRDYATVIIDNTLYVIDKSGKRIEINQPPESSLQFDKYIFEAEGLLGVKDIFGKVLIEAEYFEIEIVNDTILCKSEDSFFVFNESTLVSNGKAENISLENESLLLIDSGLINLDLSAKIVCGYRAFSLIDESIYLIEDNALFGCALENNILIDPLYYSVSLNGSEYAIVLDDEGKKLITLNNELLFFDKEIIPVYFDGQFFLYKKNELYGVCDFNFNLSLEPSFPSVYLERIFNGFIICNDLRYNVYSLSESRFLDGFYLELEYINGFFIAQCEDKSYTLFDKSFQPIISNCEFITISSDILLVAKDGKSYFYLQK